MQTLAMMSFIMLMFTMGCFTTINMINNVFPTSMLAEKNANKSQISLFVVAGILILSCIINFVIAMLGAWPISTKDAFFTIPGYLLAYSSGVALAGIFVLIIFHQTLFANHEATVSLYKKTAAIVVTCLALSLIAFAYFRHSNLPIQ